MGRRTRPPLPACFYSAAMAALSLARPSSLTAARSTTNGRRAAAVQGSRSGNNDPTNASPLETTTEMVARLSTRREPRWRVPVGEVRRTCNAPCWWWLHHHYVIRCRLPGVGRISWLLRHKGRRTPVAKAVAMECGPLGDIHCRWSIELRPETTRAQIVSRRSSYNRGVYDHGSGDTCRAWTEPGLSGSAWPAGIRSDHDDADPERHAPAPVQEESDRRKSR